MSMLTSDSTWLGMLMHFIIRVDLLVFNGAIEAGMKYFCFSFRLSLWFDDFIIFLFSFRRYFGIVITHFQVAIYTARRDEMVDVVQATLFYMNPDAPIPVHSPYSALPYQVLSYFYLICIYNNLVNLTTRVRR